MGTHGYYALGFVLGNIHLLGGSVLRILQLTTCSCAFVLYGPMVALVGVLVPFRWPYEWGNIWLFVSAFLSLVVTILLATTMACKAVSRRHFVEVMICGAIVGAIMPWIIYSIVLRFLFFTRDRVEAYRVTPTASHS